MHVSSFVALALVILGKLILTDNSTNVYAAADDEKAIYMSRFCQTGETKSKTVTNRVKANARYLNPLSWTQVPDARYKVERDKTFGVREYFRGVIMWSRPHGFFMDPWIFYLKYGFNLPSVCEVGGQVFENIDGQLNLSDLKQRSKNDYIILIMSSSSHLAVYL